MTRLTDSDWTILLEQEADARAVAEGDPAALTTDDDLAAAMAELAREVPPAPHDPLPEHTEGELPW